MSDVVTTERTEEIHPGAVSAGATDTADTARLDDLVHRIRWPAAGTVSGEDLLSREWLMTNGLGGYASGSVVGAITRRYHALLIAALPAPLGRVAMLSHLAERLRFPDGDVVWLGVHQSGGRLAQSEGTRHLMEFRLEAGLPVWRYHINDCVVEKSLLLVHGQNTLHVRYTQLAGKTPIRLGLRPMVNFRPHDAPVDQPLASYVVTATQGRVDLTDDSGLPSLHMCVRGRDAAFTLDSVPISDVHYQLEAERGYESDGLSWSPGYFRADLSLTEPVTLLASVEPWNIVEAMGPDEAWEAERSRRERLVSIAHPAARSGPAAELVLAADQFIIRPAGRAEDAARAHAAGEEPRTVIAGYHWFTDWGRDTMISLEGLTLVTGRTREGGDILRTFAQYVRDGLIPNLFPEHGHEGLYHTADATLWFFHALERYLAWTDDRQILHDLRPILLDIVDHHLRGTHFNIQVDPADGLLRQGAEGYQLTWMDAKVGDWVVTPRRGKAVEINALWYNALRLLEEWTAEAGDPDTAARLGGHAARAFESFNRRFWSDRLGYLLDVVDGEPGHHLQASADQASEAHGGATQADAGEVGVGQTSAGASGDDEACRPNQVLAMALRHPVLDKSHWPAVLDVARDRLLTPVGLRSLAPGHPDFKPRYFGDLRARDAAYHQGTVWAWLIGPFVDAWLAVHPNDEEGARACLQGFVQHLDQACIGSISEVFDAEAPFTPRGCIAQAWSVAEVLRAWVRTSSSSAAVTTDWSAPPTSREPGGA
jgi:predicted glycogen debranching enzyme